jgi:hypothetical protein
LCEALGYRLCEGVQTSGQVARHWPPPLSITPAVPGSSGQIVPNENVRQALEMLKSGHSLEDIQRELELGDEASEQLKSQLEQMGRR